jgi:hypothetical protein
VRTGARHLVTGLLLAGLGACSTTVQARPADDFTPFTELRAADFPGAAALLTGMAAPDDDRALRIGDAALFAIEMRRGDEIRRELLLLEVAGLGADEASSGPRVRTAEITHTPDDGEPERRRIRLHEVEMSLRRFDARAHPLGDSQVVLFEEALRAGWWPDADPKASRRDQDHAFAMTMSLQSVADSDPTLQDLLFVVVDKPSLFSIATHRGVKVHIRTTTDPNRPRLPPPFAGLPKGNTVAVTDKDLTINGSRALWADLIVTRPVGALGACGGLLGAVARNAADPGRTAVVRLLATRRSRAD